jgi:hypothetical protein
MSKLVNADGNPITADGTPRVVISASGSTYAHGVALAASFVLLNAAGVIHMCEAKLDKSAPSADYYALLLDAPSLPANGAVTIMECIPLTPHTTGADDGISFPIKTGMKLTTGGLLVLSTTPSTLTASGAYLWLYGAEVELST